jgi:predicted HicB family RNase H-like nuclease
MDEIPQSSIFEGEITGIRFGLAFQKEIVSSIPSWLLTCSCYLRHIIVAMVFLNHFF